MKRLTSEAAFCIMATMVCLCPALRADTNRAPVNVVPQPVSVEERDGSFVIMPSTRIVAGAGAAAEASQLMDALEPGMGYRLRPLVRSARVENSIRLEIAPSLADRLGEEGYELEVTSRSIVIRSGRSAGLFWGIQTLQQLLPAAIFSERKVNRLEWAVPCVRIVDYPRFQWRGLLIDPARHFIPVPDVKQFIDLMAIHKFNRLQIHLTDNEGWRLEIKKYPQLTELGSKMDWNLRHQGGTGPRCVGFYTQDDIRQIVRYAADRHITIVPEIEMPFHTGAAIVAYPELGINTGQLAELPPEQRWGKTRGLIAPRPETVAFLQNVLTEAIELFPSRDIHIGGDEANIGHWTGDPEMQAQMKRLQLKDAHELHSWFITQMDTFLTESGRRLLGWDEILQGGLAPGATVMSWHGQAGGISAAKAGHDVIMAPTSHTYFDYYQGPKASEPRAIGGYIPLEKVYAFEPVPSALKPEQAQHVLGGQGQLWGEYIADREHREYMTYPRAAALAETLWSPKESRRYDHFLVRLADHLKRLDTLGVNYRPLDKGAVP